MTRFKSYTGRHVKITRHWKSTLIQVLFLSPFFFFTQITFVQFKKRLRFQKLPFDMHAASRFFLALKGLKTVVALSFLSLKIKQNITHHVSKHIISENALVA